MDDVSNLSGLVCPRTRRGLQVSTLAAAEARLSEGRPLISRRTGPVPAVGPTPSVLVRDDGAAAYPVVEGVAILLAPEMLTGDRDGAASPADPCEHRYAEAYEEMAFYDEEADRETVEDAARRLIASMRPGGTRARPDKGEPRLRRAWLDATFEPAAQWDAFRHLAPLSAKSVVQLGGKGVQAVRFLLAGAAEAWIVSPMLGEVSFARRLARQVGVADRLRTVVAVAEELPFPDAGVDAVYAGSTAHHMVTELAFRECARVLRPGGRFAAIEPWKAPLYDIGISLFGKRENVRCRPMTAERAAPLADAFGTATIVHHGALTRYPLIALAKVGVPLGLPVVATVTRVDDAVCSLVPRLRRAGSSTALLARRDK
ncbi:MAG: class I SAM-dependent methyltransferase [Acidimicrobiales bacterium]